MIESIAALFLSLLGALATDSFVRPRALPHRFWLWSWSRSWQGSWIMALCAACLFGVLLSVSGHPALAAIVTVACHGVVVIASNAKRGVLGEPIVFSDLAVVGAMVKHPQFYFSVLALWQQIVGAFGVIALIAAMVWFFEPSARLAAFGLAITAASLALLWISVRLKPYAILASAPDAEGDVCAHGLIPTVLLYWLRWRAARAALAAGAQNTTWPRANDATPDDIIVVVQCESFADPSEIFKSGGITLPHLERAKASGAQWGNLHVSGFGAYTMRTEFGVLYGREETELGFLLYDPYLTALKDPAQALPQKLGAMGMRSLFVHPHDMRFYSRDQILPSAGFAELIGEESFAKPDRRAGRYVSDAAVATKILDLAAQASSPTFIYAVTMENHGPWAPSGDADVTSMIANYNRLVSAGDAMLGQLLDGLADLDRPATLVFFGDHRPTIPGASNPGGDKHTPYVIARLGGSTLQNADPVGDQDLTPAQLHEATLKWSVR